MTRRRSRSREIHPDTFSFLFFLFFSEGVIQHGSHGYVRAVGGGDFGANGAALKIGMNSSHARDAIDEHGLAHALLTDDQDDLTLLGAENLIELLEFFVSTDKDPLSGHEPRSEFERNRTLARQRGLRIWRDAFAAFFEGDSESVELADALSTMRSASFGVAV